MPTDDRSPTRPPFRVRGRDRRAVTPQPLSDGERPAAHAWRPARFLVIAAHPDDAEYGPAATAASWIDAGSIGRLICCTSGDQGGEDPAMDPLVLAATREAEQRRAAAIVGYDEVGLPPPAGRGARQRAPSPRAARAGDPAVPARRRPHPRPGGPLLPRGGRQPRRPPRGGIRRGRRGLPGSPQPDGVPRPGPGRARRPRRAPPLPLLAERADGLGGCGRDAGPQDRRAALPREPGRRSGWPRGAHPGLGSARTASRSAPPRPKPSGSS